MQPRRAPRNLIGLLQLLWLIPLSSCGGGGGTVCTSIYAYGLTVTVTDAATQQPICDATVTATDGTYSEQLQPANSSPCSYLGAGERPGTYTVTATRSGYMNTIESNIRVTSDGCHVQGVSINLNLTH